MSTIQKIQSSPDIGLFNLRKDGIEKIEYELKTFDNHTLHLANEMHSTFYHDRYAEEFPKDFNWLRERSVQCISLMKTDPSDNFHSVCLDILEHILNLCERRYSRKEKEKLHDEILKEYPGIKDITQRSKRDSSSVHVLALEKITSLAEIEMNKQQEPGNDSEFSRVLFSLGCTIRSTIRMFQTKMKIASFLDTYFSEKEIKQAYDNSFEIRTLLPGLEKSVDIYKKIKEIWFPGERLNYVENGWKSEIKKISDHLPPEVTLRRKFFSSFLSPLVKEYPDSHKTAYVQKHLTYQNNLRKSHSKVKNAIASQNTPISICPSYAPSGPMTANIPLPKIGVVTQNPYRPLDIYSTRTGYRN